MSASFVGAVATRAADASSAVASTPIDPTLVNCLMLVRFPERAAMIEQAIVSFLQQDHANRVLTIVNDGVPCALSGAFFAARGAPRGMVVQAPAGASIGEKRNLGAHAVPAARYVASFDDDDFSLPARLSTHLGAIGDAVWLSASRKFISIDTLERIIGFEAGRCYGAGMISTEVTARMAWPHVSWCEDHRLYEAVRAHPELGARTVEDDALLYVHRRHDSNASVAYRQSLWQGVLPLMLAGADAVATPAIVAALLTEPHEPYLVPQ
jgi:hypothetical protein